MPIAFRAFATLRRLPTSLLQVLVRVVERATLSPNSEGVRVVVGAISLLSVPVVPEERLREWEIRAWAGAVGGVME